MNLNLGRLPWYAQIGAFVALALAGIGAFWYVYALPEQAALATRRTQLAELQRDVERGLTAARGLPEFRKKVANRQAELDRLRVALPDERDVGDLLRQVQAMATQSNLTIVGFTPQAVATQELHAEWPIGLQLEGSYHDLGMFLERVSKFERIVNVNSINIRAKGGPPAGATITAETTATTFVLIEQAAAAEGAGRGRGRGAGARGRGAPAARGRG